MPKREPKSKVTTTIEVISRPGGKRGNLEFSSGNLIYYRQGAQVSTLRITYQQLVALLEREVEYRAINTEKIKLPKPHPNGDFVLEVHKIDEIREEQYLFSARSSWKALDERRIDLGSYQFSRDMARGRRMRKHPWFAQVSVQAALWILHRYIEKFMVRKKMTTHTDEDVVVSKQELRNVLLAMFKRLDS